MISHYLDALNKLRYRCHIDVFNGRAIRGWVLQLGKPQASSLVAAFQNGRLVSSVTKTVSRPDLTTLGWGPVAFTVELTSGSIEPVQLRVAKPGRWRRWTVVERSLKRPIGLGALDSFAENKIRGWAACFLPGSQSCEIVVYAGFEIVGRTRPHLLRSDAADAIAYNDLRIGFELSVPWRHTAFSRLTVRGEAGGASFPIGEVSADFSDGDVFPTRFRYCRDSGSWR